MSRSREELQEIAKSIWAQLHWAGVAVVWSWGVNPKSLVALDEADKGIHGRYRRGGLSFMVNGALHKGKVLIQLNGSDLYDVEIGKVDKRTGAWKPEKTVADVYCDQLAEVVDGLVETPCEIIGMSMEQVTIP